MARLTDQEREILVRRILAEIKPNEVVHIRKDLDRRVVAGDYKTLDLPSTFALIAALRERERQMARQAEEAASGTLPLTDEQEREAKIDALLKAAPGVSRAVAEKYADGKRDPRDVPRREWKRAPEPEAPEVPRNPKHTSDKPQPEFFRSWNK